MKVYSDIAMGVQTRFNCPPSPVTKFVKVNNVLVAVASQNAVSVTLASAPAAGTAVDIYYGADIVIPPAAYTATGVGGAIPPPNLANGLTLFLVVTAVSGTSPTLGVKLQVLDMVSNTWIDVPGASFPTVTGVSTNTFTMFPGAVPAANVALNQTIRNIYRAAYTIGGTTPSFTFSLGSQPQQL